MSRPLQQCKPIGAPHDSFIDGSMHPLHICAGGLPVRQGQRWALWGSREKPDRLGPSAGMDVQVGRLSMSKESQPGLEGGCERKASTWIERRGWSGCPEPQGKVVSAKTPPLRRKGWKGMLAQQAVCVKALSLGRSLKRGENKPGPVWALQA